MSEVFKYRVWCNIDSKWVETWGTTEPTVCPDNIAHTIDATKTSIIEKVSETIPLSEIGGKVWVHQSAKPVIEGKTLYAIWSGAGDDMLDDLHLGSNGLLQLKTSIGVPISQVEMKFNPVFGDVYIHQGHLMWDNAGFGDYVSADVISEATALQTFVNKDLVLNGTYIKYSTGGPGTGTHGFAETPKLLPRSFSNDGDWNYDPVGGLTPNFTGTGNWKISTSEETVHRFMNRIPVMGSSNGFFVLESSESFKLPSGYFLRIKAFNNSNTVWNLGALILIFRERTFKP